MQYILVILFHTIKSSHDLSNEISLTNESTNNSCNKMDPYKLKSKSSKTFFKPTKLINIKKSNIKFIGKIIVREKVTNCNPLDIKRKSPNICDNVQDVKEIISVKIEKESIDSDKKQTERISMQNKPMFCIKNTEKQDNLFIPKNQIETFVKELINEQNLVLQNKPNNKPDTLSIETTLINLERFTDNIEVSSLIKDYKTLLFYFKNDTVILENQIFEVLNQAKYIFCNKIKYTCNQRYINIFYNKLETISSNYILFLKNKISLSSFETDANLFFISYLDFFDKIITYMLTFRNNEKLYLINDASLVYKYIGFITEMPVFLSETNCVENLNTFIESVNNFEFTSKLFSRSDYEMLIEFKRDFLGLVRLVNKRRHSAMLSIAYILQNFSIYTEENF